MTDRSGVRDLAIRGPTPPLSGRFRPPSDKSISQRALILAALADGESEIENLLACDDTAALVRALERAGVRVDAVGAITRVTGPPRNSPDPTPMFLDVGESGTAARLLLGALSSAGVDATLTGRGSLLRRPMRRVVDILRRMGARIEPAPGNPDDDRLPLVLRSSLPLHAANVDLSIASAQVKSAVLLAALQAQGETTVREPHASRDHTERMLPIFGVPVETREDGAGRVVGIRGPVRPRPARVRVPGDPSSMLYPGVLALLTPGSAIVAEEVGLNPTRTAALDVLERMGASIERESRGERYGEPIGAVRFRSSELAASDVKPEEVPAMIDDIPILAVAAAFARRGVSCFFGVGELRVKESDRLATIVALLRAFGNDAAVEGDDLVVPAGFRESTRPISVDAAGDHRIAAAAIVAALASRARVEVHGVDAITKSYPTLLEDLRSLGASGLGSSAP